MGFWVNLAITAFSMAYQQNQQKKLREKMEAEAEKRKGFKVSASGQVEHLPIIYGKQVVGGFQTKHLTRNSYADATKPGDVFTKGGWGGGRGGSKNEFLFVQAALCQDGIQGCRYVKVNDEKYDKKEYDNLISIVPTGGTANAIATANGIPSTNYFTDTANATMVYRLNRDEPQYQGVPSNSFFILGRKIRTVVYSGGNYSLNETYTYSNNPAYCLLDYLLGEFGRGLSVQEVDLYSFYRAAQICDATVSENKFIGGRVNNVRPIRELSSYSVFPSVGDSDFIYKAEDTALFYTWNSSNPADDEVDTGSYVLTSVPSRNISLYECNIALDSEAKVRDNIERLMNTMGLAEIVWTSEGRYKLILDYPSSQAALEALVDPKHIFTEDDIIRETVTVFYPSAQERYNQVTVRFDNEHEDFKEDSVTWPERYGAVHTQYLSEDNNQPMTTDMFLDGVTDPYHALAKAEQTVRVSRSVHYLTLTVGKKGLSIEPGDFVNITIPQSGIEGSVYRVESVRIFADLTVELKCYYFDYTSLAWNIEDDIAYGNPPTYDFVVNPPQNVVINSVVFTSTDGTIYTSLEVSWDSAADISVAQYEIQWKKATDTEYRSVFTRNTNYLIQNVEPNVQYDVRVRSLSTLGITSSFGETTGTNVGNDVAPNVPTNLTARGGLSYIQLDWTNPADKDLDRIQIYEALSNDFSTASFIGETKGSNYVRANLDPAERYYYWIRSVDRTGNTSAFIGPVNDITTLLGAADIAASAIPYDAFDTGVVGIVDGILDDIASNLEDINSNYDLVTELQAVLNDDSNAYSAASNAITALKSRVTITEEGIVANAGSIVSLESSINDTVTTAISGLETRVTDNEGDILANGSAITALASSVNSTVATAISGLETRVTNVEGVNTAQASSLTTLTTDLDGLTTSVSTQGTSINGIQAQYSVEIDNNGSITGYKLISDATQRSAFNVRADQFNVSATTGADYPVFSVRTAAETINGVVYPIGAYVSGYLAADKIVAVSGIASPFADIGSVTAGTLQSSDGNFVIDLNNKTITITV